MRNRKIQRELKKYLKNGGSMDNILIIHEEKLEQTSEYYNMDGPILDKTPYQAVKPGKRMIIKHI